MKSQWECLLENLGDWQGSFTRFSSEGEFLSDVKSLVSFEGLNNNQTMRQTVRREKEEDLVLEYSYLSKGILFFENGAFSYGSTQLAPFAEFGAELGFIWQNRRLRLVELFDKNGQLDKITLIREYLAGTEPKQNPTLTVDDLLGEWLGEAVTVYTDLRSPDSFSTKMQLQLDATGRLIQSLSFGDRTITSSATIKGSRIIFDENSPKQMQVLLLPDGASATSPLKAPFRQPFILEVGWLIEPNLRQRMVRSYNDKGEWVSLTLVTEKRKN